MNTSERDMQAKTSRISSAARILIALVAALVIALGIAGCSAPKIDEKTANGSEATAATEGQTLTATNTDADDDDDDADDIDDADSNDADDADDDADDKTLDDSAKDINDDMNDLLNGDDDDDVSKDSKQWASDMQTIGDQKTGKVLVPANWKDCTEYVDERTVEDTAMVYYADPDTEYTSAVMEHFNFADSIMMRVYPTSYEEIAKQVIEDYKGSSDFGDTDYGTYKIGSRDCYLVTTSLPEDNLYICNLIIDRDNDGHACVLMTITGTPGSIEKVLSYAATWTY